MNTLSSLLNWIGGVIGANPNTLATGAKTLVGAINEVKANAITNSDVTEIGEASKIPRITSGSVLKVKSVEVDGDAMADCVIAQGKSGDWSYRKWKSGFLEQWGIGAVSANSGYSSITFPQAFNDALYRITAIGVYASGQPAYAVSAQALSESTAYIYVRNSTGTTPSVATTVNVYVAGYWK